MAQTAGSGPQGLADLHADAWRRFVGHDELPPDWFLDTAETLMLLHQHHDFPTDYMVFDVETVGGFDPTRALIIEVGWATVRNKVLVDAQSLVLDWTIDPRVEGGWLNDSLEYTKREMEKKGKPRHFTYDYLHEHGVPPWEGLHVMVTLLYDAFMRGEKLVGHNAWRFDRGMVTENAKRFMNGYQVPWGENRIIDTGLMEKGITMNRPPYDYETLDEWYTRVNNSRIKGVTWALDTVCVPKYHLVERFGLDMQKSHTAAFDCRCTHHLLETFREMIAALCGN